MHVELNNAEPKGRAIELGPVHTIVSAGYLTVALKPNVRISQRMLGLPVFLDSELKSKIGLLADVIGNTEKPYVVIRILDKTLLSRIARGEILYTVIPRPRRRGRPRRGGRGAERTRARPRGGKVRIDRRRSGRRRRG